MQTCICIASGRAVGWLGRQWSKRVVHHEAKPSGSSPSVQASPAQHQPLHLHSVTGLDARLGGIARHALWGRGRQAQTFVMRTGLGLDQLGWIWESLALPSLCLCPRCHRPCARFSNLQPQLIASPCDTGSASARALPLTFTRRPPPAAVDCSRVRPVGLSMSTCGWQRPRNDDGLLP